MSIEIGALVLGLLLTGLAMPAFIRSVKRWGYRQHVRDDGPSSHLTKEGTPTMGGVVLVGGGLAAALVVAAAARAVTWPFALAFMVTMAYGLLGGADDLLMIRRGRSLGLKARHKLLLQFAGAAAFLWAVYQLAQPGNNVYNPFGRGYLHLGVWYAPLAAVFLVGTSNAVNLTDGLDGLAGGLAAISFLCLGMLAASYLDTGLAVLCLAMAGASLGFLWHNAHPARIFMGDTGSLALGGAMAAVAILLQAELVLLFFGAVFYLEAGSVMLQVLSYKATRRRIFRMSPLHHHFELAGWPETQVVVRFWLMGAVVALVALALTKYARG